MENSDTRWLQRFNNYIKAFSQLEKFTKKNALNDMELQGLIKAFEYTFELAWKTLQDLLKEKGYTEILGPKPVIRQSFQDGYISQGEAWMQMQKSRNLTSDTYDETTAEEIAEEIRSIYFFLFAELKQKLESEKLKQ